MEMKELGGSETPIHTSHTVNLFPNQLDIIASNNVELLEAGPGYNLYDLIEVVLLLMLILLGIPLNLLKILKLRNRYHHLVHIKHTVNIKTAFLTQAISLCACNLSLICLVAPVRLVWLLIYSWNFGDVLCRTTKYVESASVTMSSYLTAVIALDRARIVLKMSADKKDLGNVAVNCMRWAYGMVSASLIVALVTSVPQLFIFRVVQVPYFKDWSQCVSYWHEQLIIGLETDEYPIALTLYQVFQWVTIFGVPFVLIVFCYSFIVFKMAVLAKSDQKTTASKEQSQSPLTVTTSASGQSAVKIHHLKKENHQNLSVVVIDNAARASHTSTILASNNHESVARLGGGCRRQNMAKAPTWKAHARGTIFRRSLLIIGCFFVTYLPYSILEFVSIVYDEEALEDLYLIAHIVRAALYMNAVFSPLLYSVD